MDLTRVLVLLGLLGGTRADCLAASDLTNLGFTPAALNITANSTVCSTYSRSVGLCVNVTALNTKMQTDMNNLRNSMYIVQQFYTVFGVINNVLKAAAANSTAVANISRDLDYIKNNATAKYAACFDTLARVQMGTTCMLASASASQSVQLNGTGYNVTFNRAVNGQRLEDDCLAVYDALCTIISGQSLNYPSISGVVPTVSGDAQNYASACRALSPYNSCAGNSTCVAAKQNQLIAQLVRPYDYSIFFNLDFLTGVENFFQGLGAKVKSFFNLRRLAASTSVGYSPQSSGDDMYVAGSSSGTAPPTAKRSALAGALGVAVLFLLL